MIITRTPLRISLVGGGTDTPAFYEKNLGAVVSFAIDKYIYISVNEKFDGKFRVSYSKTENVEERENIEHPIVRNTLQQYNIHTGLEIVSVADIPGGGTGLGSSSAFTVGLINALDWKIANTHRIHGALAEVAFQVERQSNPFIGKQDAYAAAFGGFNLFRFKGNKVGYKPIEYPDEIQDWFLLLYTGITRPSDDLLKSQSKSLSAGGVVIGREMAALAEEFTLKNIGEMLKQNWILKKEIHNGISSPQIDKWYWTALQNGAEGGKLCGAGGGGFLFFYAPPDAHERIIKATGLRRVDFRIEQEGSKVIYE
jgi:D-glycero-alpha-D-manno-heptose-7-phosphate kinase